MPTETVHLKTNRVTSSKGFVYLLGVAGTISLIIWLGILVIKAARKVAAERMAQDYATTLRYVPSGRAVMYVGVPPDAWVNIYATLALITVTIAVGGLAVRSVLRYRRISPGLFGRPPVNRSTVAMWVTALVICLVVTLLVGVSVLDLFLQLGA